MSLPRASNSLAENTWLNLTLRFSDLNAYSQFVKYPEEPKLPDPIPMEIPRGSVANESILAEFDFDSFLNTSVQDNAIKKENLGTYNFDSLGGEKRSLPFGSENSRTPLPVSDLNASMEWLHAQENQDPAPVSEQGQIQRPNLTLTRSSCFQVSFRDFEGKNRYRMTETPIDTTEPVLMGTSEQMMASSNTQHLEPMKKEPKLDHVAISAPETSEGQGMPVALSYQQQLMVLELQSRKRWAEAQQENLGAEAMKHVDPQKPTDYEQQLLLLERQNWKRIKMARQEQGFNGTPESDPGLLASAASPYYANSNPWQIPRYLKEYQMELQLSLPLRNAIEKSRELQDFLSLLFRTETFDRGDVEQKVARNETINLRGLYRSFPSGSNPQLAYDMQLILLAQSNRMRSFLLAKEKERLKLHQGLGSSLEPGFGFEGEKKECDRIACMLDEDSEKDLTTSKMDFKADPLNLLADNQPQPTSQDLQIAASLLKRNLYHAEIDRLNALRYMLQQQLNHNNAVVRELMGKEAAIEAEIKVQEEKLRGMDSGILPARQEMNDVILQPVPAASSRSGHLKYEKCPGGNAYSEIPIDSPRLENFNRQGPLGGMLPVQGAAFTSQDEQVPIPTPMNDVSVRSDSLDRTRAECYLVNEDEDDEFESETEEYMDLEDEDEEDSDIEDEMEEEE